MKKLILLIGIMLLLVPGIVCAADWNSGFGYSIADSKMNYLSTVEIAKYGKIILEAGWAGSAENTQDKVIAVVSIPLFKLADYVELPVLDLLEANIGIFGGFGRVTGSNEFDYGVSATFLSIKF